MSDQSKCSTCPHAATCKSAGTGESTSQCPSTKKAEPTCPSSQKGSGADRCAGCPNRGSCGKAKTGPTPEEIAIAKRFENVKRIIFVLSGKGGVGKSSTATQLAYWLADTMGKQVGLLDIDICGPSVPTMTSSVGGSIHPSALGWEPIVVNENLSVMSIGFMLPGLDDAVIMRGPRKHGVIMQFMREVYWGDLDYLVIDTPPGTSDEHISAITSVFGAMKGRRSSVSSIIVTTPQEVALADVRKEINFCRTIKLPIAGVVENMSGFVCPHCNCETLIFSPSSGGGERMADTMEVPFLGRLPLDPCLTKAAEEGRSWLGVAAETAGLKGTPEARAEQEAAFFGSLGLKMWNAIVEKVVVEVERIYEDAATE